MRFKRFLLEKASAPKNNSIAVFYGGRFQPMHKGHFQLYKSLVEQFGKDNVYIATKLSKEAEKQHAKGNFTKDPLTFEEKAQVINSVFGIPTDHIVQTDAYRPDLSLINRNGAKTVVVLAFSEKDAERLVPGKVLQPYPTSNENLEPHSQGSGDDVKNRSYYLKMPVNEAGMSASDFRNVLITQGKDKHAVDTAFKEFFGVPASKHPKVVNLLLSKLSP